MPNQNPPDSPEHMIKPQRFGQYGFQPLPPVKRDDIPTGVVLSEQIEATAPPMGHYQKRPIDRETIEAHMLMRARRRTTDWDPTTWTFDGLRPVQLAGIRVGRDTFLMFNGSADVLVSRSETECRVTSNKNWTLKIGNTVALETEGEFWATAQAGTTLQTIETFFNLDAMILAQKKIDGKTLNLPAYGDFRSQQQERKIS